MVEVVALVLGSLATVILLALMWSYASEVLPGWERREATRILAEDRRHAVFTDFRVRRAKSQLHENMRQMREAMRQDG